MTDDKEKETSLSPMVGQLPAYHSTEDLNQSTSLDYMTGIFSPGRATEEQRTDGVRWEAPAMHLLACGFIRWNILHSHIVQGQQLFTLIYKFKDNS